MWDDNKFSVLRFFSRSLYLVLFVYSLVSKEFILTLALICAAAIGPIFCGWLCFFGFYQDIMRYIGKRIDKEPWEVDENVHYYLRFFRYFVLAGTITIGGIFLFSDEMKNSLAHFLKGNPYVDMAFFAMLVLGLVSLFTKRFYCRYLCTFGAKLGLLSLLRPYTIKRDEKACVSCKKCSEACPMHINVHEAVDMADPNCIDCFTCIDTCPKKCLSVGKRNYKTPGKLF